MRLPLVAALFALVAVPAFGQAQNKGEVNVYNWSDYIAEDQLKAF